MLCEILNVTPYELLSGTEGEGEGYWSVMLLFFATI
jgi:hypothetical protein